MNFSESESFSITCLEALFFKCALIATRCGGPTEIIDHRETGILVPLNNIETTIHELRELMKNSALRTRLGEEGARRVRDRFSIQKTSYKLKKCYRDVLIG